MKLFHVIYKKFAPAFYGLYYAWQHKALRLQVYLGMIAVVISICLKFNTYEMLYTTIACGIVIAIELVNTSIEIIVDELSPQYSMFAKKTKDIAAAAVLAISIAVLIGFLLILKGKIV